MGNNHKNDKNDKLDFDHDFIVKDRDFANK